MLDRKIFEKCMTRASRTLNQRQRSTAERDDLYDCFQHWKDDDFVQAMEKVITTTTFFPRPVDIIRCRPLKTSTIKEIDARGGPTPIEPNWVNVDEQLSKLSREEVRAILLPIWDNSQVCNTPELRSKACDHVMSLYERGDRNVMAVVKDEWMKRRVGA